MIHLLITRLEEKNISGAHAPTKGEFLLKKRILQRYNSAKTLEEKKQVLFKAMQEEKTSSLGFGSLVLTPRINGGISFGRITAIKDTFARVDLLQDSSAVAVITRLSDLKSIPDHIRVTA